MAAEAKRVRSVCLCANRSESRRFVLSGLNLPADHEKVSLFLLVLFFSFPLVDAVFLTHFFSPNIPFPNRSR